MRRTEGLQGVRMIKFRSVLQRYESAEFSQGEAAELLGIGERTFRRWRDRYDEDGEAGLLDCRLGKASGKRVPVDRVTGTWLRGHDTHCIISAFRPMSDREIITAMCIMSP